MTPQQALNFLDQMASKAPVDRLLHSQAQQAVKILGEALAPKKIVGEALKEVLKEEPPKKP